MTSATFSVGLYPSEADWGWRRILAQEGLPFRESSEPVSPVTAFTRTASLNWLHVKREVMI